MKTKKKGRAHASRSHGRVGSKSRHGVRSASGQKAGANDEVNAYSQAEHDAPTA